MEGAGGAAGADDEGAAKAAFVFQCAVCYEDLGMADLAKMPCCFREESTTNLCRSCVQVTLPPS